MSLSDALQAEQDRFVHYVTGVQAMEDDHLNLHIMACTLELDPIQTKAKMDQRAKELLDVFTEHIFHEEEAMDRLNYPFASRHKQAHQDLIVVLLDYQEHIPTSVQYVLKQRTKTLSGHLLDHIDNYDIQFANYARDLGQHPD